ncbi:MAG: CRISPR system precrRNA processing endoribonuclease RAMP protein Cas6 [Pseudomonadota bacterium]|nr:CRISPR system precrRNA processing endoribonuclease RAMP protein Cas6 [Pseudomonadota bacterium]
MPLPEPPIASIGNRHPFLFAFRSARFRFRLCTVSHVELPAEKGSTFHGALGHLSQRQAPLSYRFLYEPTSTETAPASHRSETYRAPSRSCHPSLSSCSGSWSVRSAWASFYHRDATLDSETKRGLVDRARAIEITGHDLYWDDWSRYSGRQHTWMKFGGLLGEITYRGDLTPFLPWLALGEWMHIGGKTSFGLGRYTIELPGQGIGRAPPSPGPSRGTRMMSIHRKIVGDEHGNPQDVIIPCDEFQGIAEILGLGAPPAPIGLL